MSLERKEERDARGVRVRVAKNDETRCISTLGEALREHGAVHALKLDTGLFPIIGKMIRCAYETGHDDYHCDPSGRITWIGGFPRGGGST